MFLVMCLNPSTITKLNKDFDKFGPLSLLVQNEQNPLELTTKIYQHYFNKTFISINSYSEEPITKVRGLIYGFCITPKEQLSSSLLDLLSGFNLLTHTRMQSANFI